MEPDVGEENPGTQEFTEEEHEDGLVVTDMVDMNNVFNRLNRFAMLWTAKYCWASLVRFTSNMYRHFV